MNNYKEIFLGTYKSEIVAAYVYNKKAKELSEYFSLNDLSEFTEEYLERKLYVENIKGISFSKSKNKWILNFKINNKIKYIGWFNNKEDAINTYEFCIENKCKPNFNELVKSYIKEIRIKNKPKKLLICKKSKVKGVIWEKERSLWRARYEYNKKDIHVGYFKEEQDAIDALIESKKKYNIL